jgi:hypothetical protein
MEGHQKRRMKVNREELYERIWSAPLPEVAAGLEVSVGTLRRMCGLLEVPLPKPGHWQRTKTPRRKVLPKLRSGEMSSITLVRRGDKRVIDASSIPGSKVPRRAGGRVQDAHPLVKRAEKFYSFPKLGPHGRLKPTSNSAPNLRVTEEQKPRALKIADRLFKRLEEMGCQLDWRGNVTVATTDSTIRVSIQEEIVSVETAPPPPAETTDGPRRLWYAGGPPRYYREEPSGRLVVAIETYYYKLDAVREWREEGRQRLDGRIEEIAEGVVAYANALRLAQEEEAERRRVAEEEAERRWAEERARQVEQSRRERLATALEGWERAAKIRRFAHELEAAWAAKHGGQRPQREMETWLAWMREHADRLDPLIEDV